MDKVAMCKYMRKAEQEIPDEKLRWSSLVHKYRRPEKQLVKVLAGEAHWKAVVKDLRLGSGSRGSLRAVGDKTANYLRKSFSKGFRKPGGGRKSMVAVVLPAVRQWFETERSRGNFVDKGDLVLEFEDLLKQCVAVLRKAGRRVRASLLLRIDN